MIGIVMSFMFFFVMIVSFSNIDLRNGNIKKRRLHKKRGYKPLSARIKSGLLKIRNKYYYTRILLQSNRFVFIGLLIFSLISTALIMFILFGTNYAMVYIWLTFLPIVGIGITPREILGTEIVDASYFGDDLAAIQESIDYARFFNKPTIFVKPGTYVGSGTDNLTFDGATSSWIGIKFIGAGKQKTILDFSHLGAGAKCIELTQTGEGVTRVEDFEISDIQIIGNANAEYAIYSSYCSGFWGNDLFIKDFTYAGGIRGTGVYLEYCFRGGLTDINTFNCENGIFLFHCNAIPVINARCNAGNRGLELKRSFKNTVIGGIFESNNLYGIAIVSGGNNEIFGAYLENNDTVDILVDQEEKNFFDSSHNVIHNNYINGLSNANYGILLIASYTHIYDNTFANHLIAAITLDTLNKPFDKFRNLIENNIVEDDTYVIIPANQRNISTIIRDAQYIDKITDNGDYTILPNTEFECLVNKSSGGGLTNTIMDSYTVVPNTQIAISGLNQEGGQSLKINRRTSFYLKRASFNLKWFTAQNFTLKAYLYANDPSTDPGINGKMTGAPLATSTTTINGAALGPAYAWFDFDFDGTFLMEAGGEYVIACHVETYTAGGAHVGIENATKSHDGNACFDKGSPTALDADCNFRLYAETTEGVACVIYDSGSVSAVKTTTAGNDAMVSGVFYQEASPVDIPCIVVKRGTVNDVKVDGTIDIAINDYLATFTSDGIAQKGTVGSSNCFAIAQEPYTNNDSNGTIISIIISPR